MTDAPLAALTMVGLIDAAVLYAAVISRRVHERRIRRRIDQVRHVAAVVRCDLAMVREAA